MALYTLDELNGKTLLTIRLFINNGYRIDPTVYSENENIFMAHLISDKGTDVTIKTVKDDHKRTFTKTCRCSYDPESNRYKEVWYNAYNNIYADSEEEADREHKKWLALNLGISYSDEIDNPIQTFADRLGDYIAQRFMEDKQ